jgi:hypothetical protein
MAKDPAVLFYTQDFLVGTMTMSNEEVGKYIRLLCLQHQKGKLTLKDLKQYLADDDIDIAEKFELLPDGFYYNIKLKNETERRKKYSESRSKNGQNGGRPKKNQNKIIEKPYDYDMENISKSYENHTGTGTETGTDNLKFVTKTEIETKAARQDYLADILTGSIQDRETKDIVKKFDQLFSDEM